MTNPIRILTGDCRETLKTIPDGTVQTCVTSPPYWGLRDYGHADQIGQEPTPEAFVETMVEVFRQVRRCLHESGTLWLNLGDSYNAGTSSDRKNIEGKWSGDFEGRTSTTKRNNIETLKPKDLCMIPWRVAMALQADGWWLRSVICWHKKSCMPESATDRPTNSWEPIFLLAKSSRYFYDAEAVKEKAEYPNDKRRPLGSEGAWQIDGRKRGENGGGKAYDHDTSTRNQRNVWTLGPEPYSEAHFATFPTEIPRRAILAGTSARGCCPKCYAPWVRKTESTKTFESGSGKAGNRPNGKQDLSASETNSTPDIRMGPCVSTRTVGWEPGCDHFVEGSKMMPISCTVLDPFGGSGTTGQVALELARHAILCELNPEYTKLIERRTHVTPGLALH